MIFPKYIMNLTAKFQTFEKELLCIYVCVDVRKLYTLREQRSLPRDLS